MISPDRLDELATWRPEDDCPGEAKVRIPAEDLADLVSLIPIVRAAIDLRNAVLSHWITKPDVLRASKRMGEEMGVKT
jgi:hypothetical protein